MKKIKISYNEIVKLKQKKIKLLNPNPAYFCAFR